MNTHVTKAQAFTPSSAQLPSDMAALAFGVRKNTLFKPEGEDQYLVFSPGFNAHNDPDAKHVLGSGFSFSHAIVSARMSAALKQIKPSFYWPRLEGCTFQEKVEEGNVALQHVVVDAQGRELGRADMREKSAKLALHRALVGASDVTFEEFSAIAVPCHVEQGGRRTPGAVFHDAAAQDAFGDLVRRMYKASPVAQEGAEALRSKMPSSGRPASANEERVRALVSACTREALSSMGDAAGTTFRMTAEDGAWEAFAVLHTSHVSAGQAMRIAYEEYCSTRLVESGLIVTAVPRVSA